MKIKRILYFSLIAHLVCVFPVGHTALPLGIFEPFLIMGTISENASSSSLWIISGVLLLTGQIVTIIAVFKRKSKWQFRIGLVGLLLLASALISIYYMLPEKVPVTFITMIPFMVMLLMFLRSGAAQGKMN